jgi:hypothetical protein
VDPRYDDAFSELANAMQTAILLSAKMIQQCQRGVDNASDLHRAIQRADAALRSLRENGGEAR